MDSFAWRICRRELLKNWDAYFSSMFFYKDADANGEVAKIYMGPLWVLDNILGNLSFDTYATDTGFLWAQNGVFSNYVRALAAPLMSHSDFAALVSDKFDFLYLETQKYLAADGWLEQTSEMISDSIAMDRIRWNIYDPAAWVLNASGTGKVSTKFVHFRVYGSGTDKMPSTALGYLRYFLSERADALLLSIGGGVVPTPKPEETTTPAATTESSCEETTQPEQTTASEIPPAEETTGAPPSTNTANRSGWIIAVIAVCGVILLCVLVFLIKKKKS